MQNRLKFNLFQHSICVSFKKKKYTIYDIICFTIYISLCWHQCKVGNNLMFEGSSSSFDGEIFSIANAIKLNRDASFNPIFGIGVV